MPIDRPPAVSLGFPDTLPGVWTRLCDPVWRDRLLIGLAYTLAWGALLVNRGYYWDDWTLVGSSQAQLIHQFSELGLPLGGYVYAALFWLPLPGLVGHILVFSAYLLSTLLFHAILRRVPGLSRMDAFVAALTFALLPVNFARVALIDLLYGLSLLAFLAATWLLFRYLVDGRLGRRLLAFGLFVFSFYTASMLVLYVVPIAVAAVILRRSRQESIGSLAVQHADFLVLPVAYWFVKAALFTPTGVYEGYNALSLRQLGQVPAAMLSIPYQVLIEPLARAVSVAGTIGLVVGVAAAVWLFRRSREGHDPGEQEHRLLPTAALAVGGVVVLGLAVLAYLAVDLTPTIWDWSSRHQLLVPLGAGLLAAAAARGIRSFGYAGRAAGVVAVGLMLGISIVADARTLVAYQVDWFKQEALIEGARTLPEMATARHIRITDDAASLNALRRSYRFYEYNALFSIALGDTRRLASLGRNEPTPEDVALFISRPAYRMGEYVPTPIDLELRISPGVRPGALEILRLLVLEATGSPSFGSEAAKMIELQATPVASSSALAGR